MKTYQLNIHCSMVLKAGPEKNWQK